MYFSEDLGSRYNQKHVISALLTLRPICITLLVEVTWKRTFEIAETFMPPTTPQFVLSTISNVPVNWIPETVTALLHNAALSSTYTFPAIIVNMFPLFVSRWHANVLFAPLSKVWMLLGGTFQNNCLSICYATFSEMGACFVQQHPDTSITVFLKVAPAAFGCDLFFQITVEIICYLSR